MTTAHITSARRSYSEKGSWIPVSPLSPSRRRKTRLMKVLKLSLILVIAGGLAVFGLAGWDMMSAEGTFVVSHTEIIGVSNHSEEPLISALESLKGRNLMNVSSDEVTSLLAGIPWVEGFTCKKHFPNSLVVEVRERKGLCTIRFNSKDVELDGQGHWWEAPPGTSAQLVAGDRIDLSNGNIQNLIVNLIETELPLKIISIRRGEESNEFVLNTSGGWSLKVTPGNIKGQLSKFLTAKGWAESKKPAMKTMDVRWNDRIVLSFESGEHHPAGGNMSGRGGAHG